MNKTMSCLVLVAMFSASLLVSPGTFAGNETTHFGYGEPGSSNSLPDGELRRALESLPEAERARAVQWLQSIEFTREDLEYMKLDTQGGIYYADRYTFGKTDEAVSVKTATAGAHLLTASKVLKLHSNPGAPNTIFVDFTGGVISGTAWNKTAGIAAWNARPYDLDNKPDSFSLAEIDAMLEIWQRVSEDFTPFNVDVTTEAPAIDRSEHQPDYDYPQYGRR